MSNLVAIVGRPNVGKSTLFNRLTQTRQAIVDDVAGTTRDRQYGKCEWGNRVFSLVDTGGWVVNSDDVFEEEIRKQVKIAIDEADLILFLVDIKNGVTDLDDEVAGILRRSKTPVILVTNKMDTFDLQYAAAEFYRLGLGDPVSISAANGSGTGELLDLVVSKLPAEADAETDENIPRFAVVGKDWPSFHSDLLRTCKITADSVFQNLAIGGHCSKTYLPSTFHERVLLRKLDKTADVSCTTLGEADSALGVGNGHRAVLCGTGVELIHS